MQISPREVGGTFFVYNCCCTISVDVSPKDDSCETPRGRSIQSHNDTRSLVTPIVKSSCDKRNNGVACLGICHCGSSKDSR
jgi:hypothetical protein